MSARAIIIASAGLIALCGCAAMPERMDIRSVRQDTPRATGAEAAFEEAMALVSELKYDRAVGRFAPLESVFADQGSLDRAAECLVWEGYCNEKLGRAPQAAEMYRLTIDRYPNTRAAATARQRLEGIEAPNKP